MAVVLEVAVTADEVEIVSGRLWDLGASGIEERPAGVGGDGVVLVAGVPTEAAVHAGAAAIPGSRVVDVPDESWRDTWREHAQPVDTGDRLRVVPAWRDTTVPSGRFAITIDPGPCFGGGSHPTTRMLLGLL